MTAQGSEASINPGLILPESSSIYEFNSPDTGRLLITRFPDGITVSELKDEAKTSELEDEAKTKLAVTDSADGPIVDPAISRYPYTERVAHLFIERFNQEFEVTA